VNVVINGRVIDRQTQQGIAGISVEIAKADSGDVLAQVVTDDDGNFEITVSESNLNFWGRIKEYFSPTIGALSVYAIRPLADGAGEGRDYAEHDGDIYTITIGENAPVILGDDPSRETGPHSSGVQLVSDTANVDAARPGIDHSRPTELAKFDPIDLFGEAPIILSKKTNQKDGEKEKVHTLEEDGVIQELSPQPSSPPVTLLTEYEAIRNKVAAHTNEAQLGELSPTRLKSLSESLTIPLESLEQLTAAYKAATETRLPPEMFFALSRQGFASQMDELLDEDPKKFHKAIDRAIEAKQIPRLKDLKGVNQLIVMATERTPVATLLSHSGLSGSKKLQAALRHEGIRTLADLRRTGGLRALDNLSDSDRQAAAHLNAQSRLLTISPDTRVTSALIKKGYTGIADIALAEPKELAAVLKDHVDAPSSEDMIGRAKAQYGLVQSVSLGLSGSQATGFRTRDEWATNHPIFDMMTESCSCKDCDSAVSPRAYLADLMQYAIDHLRESGRSVDLKYFETSFHQPFGKLPSSCVGMEEEVRQVRICIEVFRAYIGPRPIADVARESLLKDAEQRYRLEVYQVLLNKLGTNLTELRLAQGASIAQRKSLADRIAISDAALDAMYLDPTSAAKLTESALEGEFGLVDTTQPPLRNIATAIFTNARRSFIREAWKAQDWPIDEYFERVVPIIDPDILGPDDFRLPYQKANAGDPDQAFDLWVARRDWADAFLESLRTVPLRQNAGITGRDFAATVGAIGMAYRGRAALWRANALSEIKAKLTTLTPENSERIVQDLKATYRLSLDAARRLIELWDKDAQFWRTPQRAPKVDESEWTEVFAILLKVVKTELSVFWINEEIACAESRAQTNQIRRVWLNSQDASQALFGPREFWQSIGSSTDGEWPPIRVAGIPLIDPELVKRDDLPEPVAGRRNPGLKDARTMWEERTTALNDKRRALVLELENADMNAVLGSALGPIPAGAGVASWGEYLQALDDKLSGTNAGDMSSAKQIVEQTLHLTIEKFQRLVTVIDAQSGVGGRPLPTAAELAEVFTMLINTWKLVDRYPAWSSEEIHVATGVEPWRCRRHALSKWRATIEERQQWLRTLSVRSRPPLIDPDLLTSVGYLKTPGSGHAWTLWDQRQTATKAKFREIQATARTIMALNQLTDKELGPSVLSELAEARKAGKAIETRLQQLNLSFQALRELLHVRDLLSVNPPQPVLDAEWDMVSSILTQVWKERQFAEWGLEERVRDLSLSPVFFQLLPVDVTRFPPSPPPVLDVWRGPREILLDWEDRLQSRIDQDKEIEQAVERAVSEAEEQCLPALRDALLTAAAPVGSSFMQAQRWLGDHLAISTEYSGCHTTTRISQAIETFQGILWGVRTGILADQYPNLTLTSDNFDEEFKWIGSYATWRAAMFVHLYPENPLLPSLRRVQTPGFRELVEELRGARRLTPVRARQVAERYAAYFRDICSLEIKATCRTMTTTPDGERELLYLFGVGGETGTVYWCTYDAADSTGYPLSFWSRIEGLDGKIARIVGADSYKIYSKRYLYLFLTVESEGNRELAFSRYDLRSHTGWSPEITPLKPPKDAGAFSAALMERLDESHLPTLAIRAANGMLFQRFLNEAGLDWAEGEWVARDRVWKPWQSPTLDNTDNASTQANASRLKSGSRFFASHIVDPDVVYVVCLGQDGQAYGFKLSDYFLTRKLRSFDGLPRFVGFGGGNGGITGIARHALLPNSSDVAAQVDLFAVGDDRRMYTAHWDFENGWAQNRWSQLGDPTDQMPNGSPVEVTARTPNILDVFAPRPYQPNVNGLMGFWKRWGKPTNYIWENYPLIIPHPYYVTHPTITAFSLDPTRLDVIFNEQTDDPSGSGAPPKDVSSLAHITWSNTSNFTGGWRAGSPDALIPDSRDVSSSAYVAVAVRARNEFEVLVSRTTGGIWAARRVIDSNWSKWEQIGDHSPTFPANTHITAVTRSANRVLAFVIDEHDAMDVNGNVQKEGAIQSSWQQDGLNDEKWFPWAPINFPPTVTFPSGGYVASQMAIDSGGKATVRLFAIDTSGALRWTEAHEDLPVRSLEKPSVWKPLLWDGASLSDLVIAEQLPESQRVDRTIHIRGAYTNSGNGSQTISEYLKEMFYFVPLHIALQLQKSGAYIEALDWFRLVYDYTVPPAVQQLVGLPAEASTITDGFARNVQNWLLDPLNPHSIAVTRRHTYTRYTLMAIVRCCLEYADSEFTKDTPETVPKARELYETALRLLDSDDLRQGTSACEEVIGQLKITIKNPEWQAVSTQLVAAVKKLSILSEVKDTVKQLNAIFAREIPDEKKYEAIRPIIEQISSGKAAPVPYGARLRRAKEQRLRIESAVLTRPDIVYGLSAMTGKSDHSSSSKFETGSNVTMNYGMRSRAAVMPPSIAFSFCVPANPVLRALRLHADLNLYKLNNCRNIAGLERHLDFFAAATDTVSGMPVIGGSGQLVLPGLPQRQTTVYRYAFLIDRAKQLVQQAVQIEAAYLSAIEKSEKEAYDLLTARGNVRLAQAGVRLQDLKIVESQDGVKSAELQRDRVQIQVKTYEEWINQGLMPSELAVLGWYDWLAAYEIESTIRAGVVSAISAGANWTLQLANAANVASQSLTINAQREINRLNVMIGFERRMEEWTLQKALADQDAVISEQQIVLANDRVRITEQERVIEQLKADQAKEMLDFLTNKFTSKELYDWMSNVLENVYSLLLQQATSVARLAADQLAFERQEAPPAYIQEDYWEAPTESTAGQGEGESKDRRGLTGSARLLQDISQLDHYAFEKNQRRHSITKTISLAQHDPLAFHQFLETGVLPFVMPLELFDRDFPGLYVCLIKRVRTSVIALIPPTLGIRATLTLSGLSRVVISGDLFQTIAVRRSPEVITLSAAANASGVSELQEQSEMLLPGEGHGVATSGEFMLPKTSNPFDFSTIADVLITVDYTALFSVDYRQQVIQRLNAKRTVSQDRAFSFRHTFADAWYDLHNSELTPHPMSVSVQISREDFPSNVDNLRIDHVTLYFSRKAGANIEFDAVDLRLIQTAGGLLGGVSGTDNGVISTRSSNGGSWLSMKGAPPTGQWRLTLSKDEEVQQWFRNGDVKDILLIVTYAGRLPEWPS